KVNRPQMQPTARAINSLADKLRQEQEENAGQIHRQRAPTNPAIVNQTRNHERKKTNRNPVCLLAPEICGDRISPHASRAEECYNAKYGKREHREKKKPVEPKQFSKNRR